VLPWRELTQINPSRKNTGQYWPKNQSPWRQSSHLKVAVSANRIKIIATTGAQFANNIKTESNNYLLVTFNQL
jgi:hypothetical protein